MRFQLALTLAGSVVVGSAAASQVLPRGSEQVVSSTIDGWKVRCFEDWKNGVSGFSCDATFDLPNDGAVLLQFDDDDMDVSVWEGGCASLEGGVTHKLPLATANQVSEAISQAMQKPAPGCRAPKLVKEALDTADSLGRLLSEATKR